MIKELKNTFFQVFTVTTIWVSLLCTAIFDKALIDFSVWNVIGVATVAGLLFGVMYDALWNYFTLKPIMNIIISSVFNTIGGFLMLFLISRDRFDIVVKWAVGIFILELILHTIAFYFYAKYGTKKTVEKLNKSMREKNI